MKTKLKICDECKQEKPIWKREGRILYCKICWSKILSGDVIKPIIKKQKPISKQSDKRKKQTISYTAARKVFLDQHSSCMIAIPSICSGQRTCEVHHTFSGKDRDKYFLDQSTWLATDQPCHDWVHNHPMEAREMGFLK